MKPVLCFEGCKDFSHPWDQISAMKGRSQDSIKSKIIVALDVATKKEALAIVEQLKDRVAYFMVGLELINSVGYGIVQKITELGGKVFLDLKFFDIPSTVASASASITRLGVSAFDVHALGGIKMMDAARSASTAAAKESGVDRPLIFAVTVLSSVNQETFNHELYFAGDIEGYVLHLAKIAQQGNMDGAIVSSFEARAIKVAIPDLKVVVAGIRPDWTDQKDQSRVVSPQKAIRDGADYLVLGRALTHPPKEIGSPAEALRLIEEEMQQP
jgi:orotidine-5'-phosphate decarboxylase